jgi:NAD(P)-dependent dehydrogenase (short-subunit alcohol dehydrogenase family)
MSAGEFAPPAARFSLDGKVCLVTGGSRGLGRAMVMAFAAAGADVVISSRKHEACVETAHHVEKATGRRALPFGCHMGDWSQIDGLVEVAYAEFGKVDVLVNNAGMSPLYPSPSAVTEDLYDKVYDVNAKGPFRLSALVGQRMYEAGSGSIINISSIGSITPTWSIIPYAGAKAAINAMTVAFADAFAPRVRVNCIIPGAFRTDVTRGWSDDQKAVRHAPLERIGEPDEIVGAALYLASEASSYTTGSLLRVDGGASRTT